MKSRQISAPWQIRRRVWRGLLHLWALQNLSDLSYYFSFWKFLGQCPSFGNCHSKFWLILLFVQLIYLSFISWIEASRGEKPSCDRHRQSDGRNGVGRIPGWELWAGWAAALWGYCKEKCKKLCMAVHGCTWLFVAMHGCEWLCMTVHGYARLCMAVHGYTWLWMAIHGSAWLCMAVLGYAWLYMAVNVYTWLFMAMHGCMWLCMAVHGCAVQCSAVNGCCHGCCHTPEHGQIHGANPLPFQMCSEGEKQ